MEGVDERRLVGMATRRGEGGEVVREAQASSGPAHLSCDPTTPLLLLAGLPTTTGTSVGVPSGLLTVSFFLFPPVPPFLSLLPLSPLRRKSQTCSLSPSSPPTVTLSHPTTVSGVTGSPLTISDGVWLKWLSRNSGTRSSSEGCDMVRV